MAPGEDGELVPFITPTGDVVEVAREDLIGKPYVVAVFAAGFGSGVDLPLHTEWGFVPDSLEIEYASPARFAVGPYDLSLIVYTLTDITDELREEPFAPIPMTGELSAFTISQAEVREGDPELTNGVIRMNLDGDDVHVALENRVELPISSAFVDTIMAVP